MSRTALHVAYSGGSEQAKSDSAGTFLHTHTHGYARSREPESDGRSGPAPAPVKRVKPEAARGSQALSLRPGRLRPGLTRSRTRTGPPPLPRPPPAARRARPAPSGPGRRGVRARCASGVGERRRCGRGTSPRPPPAAPVKPHARRGVAGVAPRVPGVRLRSPREEGAHGSGGSCAAETHTLPRRRRRKKGAPRPGRTFSRTPYWGRTSSSGHDPPPAFRRRACSAAAWPRFGCADSRLTPAVRHAAG